MVAELVDVVSEWCLLLDSCEDADDEKVQWLELCNDGERSYYSG